jgi:protein-S-isoprenylcysteine O-methyltransferase Ste14
MFTLQNIILACWIAFPVYWLIQAWKVKPTQEMKVNIAASWWEKVGKIVVFFLFLACFGYFLPINPLTYSFIPKLEFLRILSTIIVFFGIVISIIARKTIATNWSANIEFKKGHELITTGIYSYVRHPIYTGILLMLIGTFLFTGTLSAILLFLIILFFVLYKIRQEEELLIKHFPKEYPIYRKRAKSLIPFIL